MKTKHSKYAYVWLLMMGDNYAPGILVSAYSIKRLGTKNDLVCMVTPDVSKPIRKELLKVLDRVIEVPYLIYDINTKDHKFPDRYNTWMQKTFTKWNCLNLSEYDKIFFIDADCIAMRPMDHVFKITPPLGIFDRRQVKRKQNFFLRKGQTICNYLQKITKEQIKKALNNRGFVSNASSVLLTPSKKAYREYIAMMKKMKPFGFRSISGHDEQSLAYYLSVYPKGPQLDWRNLGIPYQYILWMRRRELKHIKKIYVIDYMGDDKPWNQPRREWEDLELWYVIAKEMILVYPNIKVKKLNFTYPKDLELTNDYDNKYMYFLSKPAREVVSKSYVGRVRDI